MYNSEKKYLTSLIAVEEIKEHIPAILYFNDLEKFILMEYKGLDGVELYNAGKYKEEYWFEFIDQVAFLVDTINKKGLSHRDIKPENVVFSEETGKWSLIDFAFMEKSDAEIDKKNFKGTFPYTPPFCGNYNMMMVFNEYNPPNCALKAVDYFAFAMSALSMAGIQHVSATMSVRVDLRPIYDIYKNPKTKLIKAIVDIVVSCLDINYSEMVWTSKNRYCMFNKPYVLDVEEPVERNVFKCWDRLMTLIIENQKPNLKEDVQDKDRCEQID